MVSENFVDFISKSFKKIFRWDKLRLTSYCKSPDRYAAKLCATCKPSQKGSLPNVLLTVFKINKKMP